MKIKMQTGAKGFSYLAEPQRSKPWYDIKLGKPSASGLERWMAVGVRDGKPIKSRYDYERELLYERTFGVSFDHFVSDAMEEGTLYEPIIKERYEQVTGNKVDDAGAFYNDFFVASPDGLVGKDGGTEYKLLRDQSFMDVLLNGIPPKFYKQVQGCLWASGREWWDFVAANIKTKKLKIIRVYPDLDLHAKIKESVEAGISLVNPFDSDGLFELENVADIETQNLNAPSPWQ
jgi:YqaJ-like viral recombinase domain